MRAGSAVAALLLWELRQSVTHLKPVADAFRAGDAAGQGVLGLPGFRVFCAHLNPVMTEDEVGALFYEVQMGQQHDQVTFSAICRALLPAL